jgi:hypothetical protein
VNVAPEEDAVAALPAGVNGRDGRMALRRGDYDPQGALRAFREEPLQRFTIS